MKSEEERRAELIAKEAAAMLALQKLEADLGPDDPGLVRALVQVSEARRFMRDRAGAQGPLWRAIAIIERAHGADSVLLALPLRYLGSSLRLDGQLDKALVVLARGFEIASVDGVTNPSLAGIADGLSWTFEGLGRLEEAQVFRDKNYLLTKISSASYQVGKAEREFGPAAKELRAPLVELHGWLVQLDPLAAAECKARLEELPTDRRV